MKQRSTFLLFIAYVWTKTLLGLATTPYKSVRELTRHRVLLPVLFSPLYGLAVLFVVGRIGSSAFEVYGLARSSMAFILSSALISILMWQALLIYLLLSFYLALRKT